MQQDPLRVAAVVGYVAVEPADRLADVVRVIGEADPVGVGVRAAGRVGESR